MVKKCDNNNINKPLFILFKNRWKMFDSKTAFVHGNRKMTEKNSSSKESIDREIEELCEKKSQIQKSLLKLEKQIYNLETSYLEDANQIGNLIKGWEGAGRFVVSP
jgi:uncharacterized protein YlxW (UPF0749 family)